MIYMLMAFVTAQCINLPSVADSTAVELGSNEVSDRPAADGVTAPQDTIAIITEGVVPDDIYADGYDSYFIDTYSRTFPTEDRARVMEYAMIGWDWMFSEDGSAPLREKLRYYADCIRDCFDTAGWPAVTRWEQPLQNSATGGESQ